MEIQTPVTSTTRAAAAPPSAAAGPRVTSDFDTFLRMLTVQMQNQDPLNPIDSADYAVQLATFSGVEQQTRTNQLIERMLSQSGLTGLAQMAGWVGNEARSAAPEVTFTGAPVAFSARPDPLADAAVLVVRDDTGRLVGREDLPPGQTDGRWTGMDMAGRPLPPGRYQLAVESLSADRVLSSRPVETYARILEVQSGPAGMRLILEGGIDVAAEAVTALRRPQG